ncbi:hypothetical protein [Desertivibrio insolitus]|uniref:hypothetical protein n=1 Tax=Herbiconiux sp. SYSU D00978 TaxID=2812562 RepID=UPI001A9610AB|nr:hypothetical protein [Herbiconiux sp. SYSU D00978]
MADENALPPVEAWWPNLSIDAKHSLTDNLDDAVPADVISEIEATTSKGVDVPAYLSDDDKQYIREQGEVVD